MVEMTVFQHNSHKKNLLRGFFWFNLHWTIWCIHKILLINLNVLQDFIQVIVHITIIELFDFRLKFGLLRLQKKTHTNSS